VNEIINCQLNVSIPYKNSKKTCKRMILFTKNSLYLALKISRYLNLKEYEMARKCQVTGTGPQYGSSISHAHNKTKRRFLPNLQTKKIWVQELNREVTVKLTAKALKTISKNGTSDLAKMIREKKIKVH
jgi:large subunit ribosomal protein L28